ncbi:hypothetical protein FDB50_15850 [Clostridium botulinum]|uniref:Uncharacterized protein n=1 Tax=Clostridium botulinum TaxID=1491 RepID=A0A6M0V6J3_CLOBO|nr:hypothetical protein [Clostridium botulinum]MCS6112454.1 hypothetical protein [Clostridium botulinum]NFF88436.1 hypothetical protein [Clostridium botulinum]NFG11478.1 hypothetical protein [Clostridium botulinum]NFL43287.1 hypothetical protein [Clostridium botulinum]NFN06179.1 hypothetical protein [Clostridium botulinum]
MLYCGDELIYCSDIKSIIDFVEDNKYKCLVLPVEKRLLTMNKLIENAGLASEFENKSDNELEDTKSEINDILKINTSKSEQPFDLIYEVMMVIDDICMILNKDLDESVDELIKMFDSNYDKILDYLSDKYDVYRY